MNTIYKFFKQLFTSYNIAIDRLINEDGHPFMRKCAYHEILLSFNSDIGREYFEKFWEEKGAELLAEYMKEDDVNEIFINNKIK